MIFFFFFKQINSNYKRLNIPGELAKECVDCIREKSVERESLRVGDSDEQNCEVSELQGTVEISWSKPCLL